MHILLVEDDDELASRLERGLRQAGFVVERASDGHDGLELALQPQIDMIVLDLGLPGKSGLEVLREIRSRGITTSVLVLTARGTWADKIGGLNDGADDYLTKPFHLPELIARLNALRRRSSGHASSALVFEDLSLNVASGEVMRNGEPVDLTALELRMLKYFMHRIRHVVSQSDLVEHLYNVDDMRESNTIEVYISRLRRKIGSDKIRTIRGLGYRFG
ncbi:MAG TPA: response regulator transcription factor [Hyphomonadaceae bacterium]|nr:response regulator transcription factor [Hyphomonadaceae bacterium]